jgi:hypothetical protein
LSLNHDERCVTATLSLVKHGNNKHAFVFVMYGK